MQLSIIDGLTYRKPEETETIQIPGKALAREINAGGHQHVQCLFMMRRIQCIVTILQGSLSIACIKMENLQGKEDHFLEQFARGIIVHILEAINHQEAG